jgi:hypothetical protein
MAAVAGPDWTRDYDLAWSNAFAVVADVMLEGSLEADLEKAA